MMRNDKQFNTQVNVRYRIDISNHCRTLGIEIANQLREKINRDLDSWKLASHFPPRIVC
jgi:predicted fused transcriptional regulator/phosphomethylpyrimidine kinase